MGATDSSTATGCGVQSVRFRKAAQVLVDGGLICEGLLGAPPAEAGNRWFHGPGYFQRCIKLNNFCNRATGILLLVPTGTRSWVSGGQPPFRPSRPNCFTELFFMYEYFPDRKSTRLNSSHLVIS